MTDEMMSLQALLEKSPDTDQLREMIGFAAHRLMELEVESLTGATHGERTADRSPTATGIATAIGKPAPGRWSCASRSCARAATFRAFSSRAGWPRRR
jgi:hypothetical protein